MPSTSLNHYTYSRVLILELCWNQAEMWGMQPSIQGRQKLLVSILECTVRHDPVLLLGALHMFSGVAATCVAWPTQHERIQFTCQAVCP